MRDFILRRLVLVPPIMLAVSFLTFLMFRIIPGDAAVFFCGFGCTPEVLDDIRHQLGLDRPWYVQYGDWLWGIVRGDFGSSFHTSLPVTTELGRRLPVTLELVVLTVAFSLLLGIPPGILSAIRPNGAIDWVSRVGSVLWLSIPTFWLGVLVITFGFIWFNYTPPQFYHGYVSFLDDPWLNIQQFFFPSLVFALAISATIMRLMRSALLEVLRQDFIRTAWAKGLRERTVILRHAVKNAMIPIVTVIGLQIGGLLGGTVVVESVFGLNGIGRYTLESIILRDLLVVQTLVLIFAAVYVVANLTVDIAYAWLDPRIRYA
jgi:peptide/nickel transport system permease protein